MKTLRELYDSYHEVIVGSFEDFTQVFNNYQMSSYPDNQKRALIMFERILIDRAKKQ